MLEKYFVVICVWIICQYQFSAAIDTCKTRSNCQECIRDSTVCVWCAMNELNGTRCKPLNSYENSWCSGYVQNPLNDVIASESKEFRSDGDDVIQIKPQQYNLKLRPGKAEYFNFSFQAAEDFPVDLYFLLDASKTMQDIRNMTAAQSENIYSAIKKMTSNVNLGFGTFVDKKVLPFSTSFDTNKTYSFHHRLKLIDDFNKFKRIVSEVPVGINRDLQEGGLDALAQVMVCKELIGWRNESRKIVVFLTDGPYHAAGDGKSGGLLQPYDGKCYTEVDLYTKEQVMDYPSVGMINKLATERDIIILFLVETKVEYIYHGLSGAISGSRLKSYKRVKSKSQMQSDAIVKILEEIYESISKKIKLKVNVRSGNKKNLEITFKPDCTKEVSDCDVEIGKEKQLIGIAKVLKYDDINKAVVDVVVESTGEKLTLNIDVIKDCSCEKDAEEHSKYCYGEKRVCGICSCSDKRYGERCACEKSGSNTYNDTSSCRAEGTAEDCSGHGSCVCGTCQCRLGYEGKFCECNMDSCPRDDHGDLCGGHGKCICGKCQCFPEWSGEVCDCYNSNIDCKENDGSICNNRGYCLCGSCKCNKIADWDARNVQDRNCKVSPCPDCHKLQCKKLEECARCQQQGKKECPCDYRIKTLVKDNVTEYSEYLNDTAWNVCDNILVGVGCYTSYVYQYNDTHYTVNLIVTTDKDCAQTYFVSGAICLLILILIGIGTLIAWKLLTEARDRQEYLKFMKQNQQDNSAPVTNSIYVPPSTTINNPTFRKKSTC